MFLKNFDREGKNVVDKISSHGVALTFYIDNIRYT
jgi:hypothetical protein